jgi:hypothetical protein
MVPRDFNAFRTSCRCPNVLISASIIFSHDHLALDSHAKYIFEQGQAKISRIPAAEIEQVVVAAVRQHVRATAHERNGAHDTPELNDKDLISTQVARVDVKSDHLVVRLAFTSEQQSGKKSDAGFKFQPARIVPMAWGSGLTPKRASRSSTKG